MPTKLEKLASIALIICNKPIDITPEECYSTPGKSSFVCRNHGKCRIWEKSEEQSDYILHNFNLSSFLIACAGSGKTEVVGFKAAYEINQWEKSYAGIAVLTFTNNAATMIQERVSQVAGASGVGYPHFIGTFDSWLHRYIANPFIHLKTGYQGKEGDCSLRLIEDRLDAGFLNSFKTTYQYWKTGYIKANEFFFLDSKSNKIVFSSSIENFDHIRNQENLEDWQKQDLVKTKKKFWKNGFVTYQDVEYLSYSLLSEYKDASSLISKRFPVIIIDECQDLAWPQLQILQQLLDKGTIIHFIGDLNQGIYSFRKVDPEKVKQFADDNHFSKLLLTQNFRSLQPIVDVSGKLVAQGLIRGVDYSDSSPICLCLSYKKTEMQKLPDRYISYLERQNIDLTKCAILTRNNNTVSKLRPGVNNNKNRALLPVYAIQIWKLPGKNIDQKKEALSSIGKFVASSYYSGQTTDRNNQSCPEEIKSKVKWRLFISDILNLCCESKLLSNLDLTWKIWAKAVRDSFDDIVSKSSNKYEIVIDLKNTVGFIAPKGVSDKKVSATTETICSNPSQPIRITNFHQIKGETLESVMIVSSPTNQGGGEGYWKNWLKDPTSENARFAYVASTRPRKTLIWAVPDHLDADDIKKLTELGFTISATL